MIDNYYNKLNLNQYVKFALKNKVNFNSLLDVFSLQIDYIYTQLKALSDVFFLNKANSFGLDFIGVIVGMPRPTSKLSNNNFILDSSSQGFDAGIFDNGGDYIDDETYRLLLKATILKNNMKYYSREDVILYQKTLIPNENFTISEDIGVLNITYANKLSDISYQFLSQYPLEILGIKINYEVPA